MMAEFIDSWSLFYLTYLAGWLLALLLSLLGVVVVARDQIFIGAAVSQASTLGIAAGMWLPGLPFMPHAQWLDSPIFLAVMAVVFSMAAALITTRHKREGRASSEEITGWVFLAASGLAVLLMAGSPHGTEEIHRLLASSIIGASLPEVILFAVLAAAALGVTAARHRTITLVTVDPEMAATVGIRARLWSTLLSVALGLVIGLAIGSSGMLYTFGCLVLPAMAAKSVCRQVRHLFWVAPLLAVAAAVAAFVLANHHDFPPAQLTVSLLALLVLLGWLYRALARR
jgi:ABC-type Mn2+/Zn2+ transport system permease subunit